MIRYESVCREYGPVKALDTLSLEVSPGSIYALLGPNGAGKTTALRIAMGLTQPTSGTVRLSDVDVRTDPIGAKAVAGFLPDSPSYYRHMTADSFLEFLAAARGLPEDSWRPLRDSLLERLGLVEARGSKLANFSFGMLRKTALIGALLHRPAHLLLDEPTAGLDPWSVRSLKDLMLEERERGAALLVSSHDLDTVAEVSDRLGIIFKGRLIRTLEGGEIPERARAGSAPLESMFLEATREPGGPPISEDGARVARPEGGSERST